MKSENETLVVKIDETKPRKRVIPRSAFQAGNEHRFRPGESGNPSGGRPKDENRLLSKALKVQLANRAPDKVAKALSLPRGASWSQCISMVLIRSAVRGDLAAAREIREATEGVRSRLELVDESVMERPPITVVFEESIDGRLRRLPSTIDGRLADENEVARQLAAPSDRA